MELHELTIAQSADLIRSRQLSPIELTEACLRHVQVFNDELRAFNTVTAELAMRQARLAESELAAGRHRGPLHGIPFGLKDVYDVAGLATTGYSRALLDNVAATDAFATAKLFNAGAVLLGKMATHELAHGGPSLDLPWPPARNPWNTERFTGGSSTGPGAGVAAGMVPFALGSDTGGSVRIPAALCGVVGLKPTYGLVSRAGVLPNSFSFDHCGPLTWTVEDCAIVLQAIAGHDANDPSSACRDAIDYRAALDPDIRGLRVGVVRHFWESEAALGGDVRRAMDAAVEVLSQLGAWTEDVRLQSLQSYHDVKNVIAKSETFAVHRKRLAERIEDFGHDFLGLTLPGCLFQAADYVRAQRERRRMLALMQPIYRRYDVLLTACSGPAPRLDAYSRARVVDHWRNPNLYTPFSVTAGPTLVVCNGFSDDGMPLAMQFAARPFDESTVLRIGNAYERATNWRRSKPRPVRRASEPAPAVEGSELAFDDPDDATRSRVSMLVAGAGLALSRKQLGQLCAVAPLAFEMAKRLSDDHAMADEPMNVLRL